MKKKKFLTAFLFLAIIFSQLSFAQLYTDSPGQQWYLPYSGVEIEEAISTALEGVPSNAQAKDADLDSLAKGLLAGGTSGQVLKKNSNTNYDFDWINEDNGLSQLKNRLSKNASELIYIKSKYSSSIGAVDVAEKDTTYITLAVPQEITLSTSLDSVSIRIFANQNGTYIDSIKLAENMDGTITVLSTISVTQTAVSESYETKNYTAAYTYGTKPVMLVIYTSDQVTYSNIVIYTTSE